MTIDMKQVISGVVLTKVCNISPDKDKTESKQVTIKVNFEGAMLEDVFSAAMNKEVIRVQNAKRLKGYDSLVNGQVIKVNFAAPMKTVVDPEAAMIAKLQAMTPEDVVAYLNEMAEKAKK